PPPPGSTTAVTNRPQSGSAVPTTHTWAIPGTALSSASTSPGCTFTPPVRITSSTRPVMLNTPSSYRPTSAVRNQRTPPRSTKGCPPESRYPSASIGPRSSTWPARASSTCTPASGTPSYTHPPQVSVMP